MTYSKETLEAAMNSLTENTAMVMIGQAGGKRNLESLIKNLGRNFNANIPQKAFVVITNASKRFTAVNRHHIVTYKVTC